MLGINLLVGVSLFVKFDVMSLSLIVVGSIVMSFLVILYFVWKVVKVNLVEVLCYEWFSD